MKHRNSIQKNKCSNYLYRNAPYHSRSYYRRQVFIEFRELVTPLMPLRDRKYTMTHSDETGDLFVTVATMFAEDKVGPTRDEVRLEWSTIKDMPILYGEVLIDGEGISPDKSEVRDNIFKREMPLALQAIYHADEQLFNANPELKNTPVLIHFISSQASYNKLYSFGTIGEYNIIPS